MNALLKRNLISTKEASDISGYNADYLSRLCREGRIQGTQVGRAWLIEREALDAFMAAQVARKIELSESLARARGEEYRKANLPAASMTRSMERRTKETVNSVMGALTSMRMPRLEPLLTGRLASVALTSLVISASVLLAGTNAVGAAGASLLSTAFSVRALAIEGSVHALAYADGRRAALREQAALEAGTDAFVHPVTLEGLVAGVVESVEHARSYDVRETDTDESRILAAVPSFETDAAAVVASRMHEAGEEAALYANVPHDSGAPSPSVLAAIADPVFAIGDAVLSVVSRAIVHLPGAYDATVIAFVSHSSDAGARIADTSYALGGEGRRAVASATAPLRSLALGAGSVSAPQTASPLAALDTGGLMQGFLSRAGALLARIFTGSDAEIAIVDADTEGMLPGPSGTQAPGAQENPRIEAPGTTTINQTIVNNNGPVTIVNQYQGLTGGVPQSYVDTQLWLLEDRLVRSIDNSRRSSRGGGSSSGSGGGISSIDNLTGTNVTLNNSAFNGGTVRALSVEAADYIAGPYVLATSTTATSAFSGNIAVGRDTTLGTTASDLLTVNSRIASSLVPSATNTYDIGSASNIWRRGYFDELVVNNLSIASSSVNGTASDIFTVNSDNATNDTEDSSISFNRGLAAPDALLTWNATTKRFEFNMPVFSGNGTFTNATATNLSATSFALGTSTFTNLLGSGLTNIAGVLTLDRTGDWTGTFDGQEGTYYLNRANHTGTQLASTISDFNAAADARIAAASSTVRGMFSSTATGLTYAPSTGVFSLTPGYMIPTTASTTAWNTFYQTPSTRIAAGNGLAWTGNTLSVSTSTFTGPGSGFNADFLDGFDSSYFLANSFSTTSANYWLGTRSTDNLSEGSTNLYFSNARARSALSGGSGITYSTSTGSIALDRTGDWTGTFDGQEGTYYLNRANHTGTQLASTISNFTAAVASVIAGTTTDALAEGATNLYYTNARVRTYLDTLDRGYFFSTTSAQYFLAQNQNASFSTTSANYWLSTKSTTDLAEGANLYYTNARVNAFVAASSTIAKTYTPNTFSALQTFTNGVVTNALTIGTLNGVLRATGGVVAASLVDLSSDVSGVLPAANGGTGLGTYAVGDLLYADSATTLARLPIGSSGQVLKVQAGLPSWGIDQTVGPGSGGGDGIFATSTGIIYPVDTASTVIIGSNATSTANSIFEVAGRSYFSSAVGIGTTSPAGGTMLAVSGDTYVTGGLGVGIMNAVDGTLRTLGNATIGNALAVIGDTTLANATSTSLFASTFGLGTGNYFTSLLGSGLVNVGGALTLDRTGDWTGTFDGQEGTYYLNRANHTGTQLASTISDFATTARGLFSATAPIIYNSSTGNFSFSTTTFSGPGSGFNADFLDGFDSSYFLANSFSTTSANYWLGTRSTDNLSEGSTNLYFSNARARNALSGGSGITYSTTTGAIVLDRTGDWTGTFDGQDGTYYLSRANHTGTQLASTISDFATTARGLFSSTATGLTYTAATGVFSLTSGYTIPTTASTTAWDTFYQTPSTRITAGSGLTWTGNTLSVSTSTFPGGGNFFTQGGNTFGTTAILGTNDAQNLVFETNNTARLTIDSAGNVTVAGLAAFSSGVLVAGDTITDFTGNGLAVVGGALTVSTTSLTNLDAATLNGQPGSYYLNRANHTGTQLAATISNFTTTARGLFSSTATGLTYTSSTGVFSLTSGYTIPTTASTTAWDTFYQTPSTRITAGNGLAWTGNTLSVSTSTFPGGGNFFTQGGNSFGTAAILGTNDNFALQFETNNASRMTILENGNVGIGTTNPTGKLHVKGDFLRIEESALARTIDIYPAVTGVNNRFVSNGGGGFNFENVSGLSATVGPSGILATTTSSSAAPAYSFIGDTDTGMYRSAADTLGLSTGGASRLLITPAGYVGIGTTTPSTPLYIWSDFPRVTIDRSTNNGGNSLVLFNQEGVLKAAAGIAGSPNSLVTGTVSGDYVTRTQGGNMYFTNDGTGAVSHLAITSAGNVGVGTTSPGALFAVAGPALVSGTATVGQLIDLGLTPDTLAYADGTRQLASATIGSGLQFTGGTLSVSTSTFPGGGNFFTQGGNSFGTAAILGTNDNFALQFETNNASRMTILENGNVGIGTTSPVSLLSVGGQLTLGTTATSSLSSLGSLVWNGTSFYGKTGTATTTVSNGWFNLAQDNSIDVFLIAGQSNADGRGVAAEAPRPAPGTVLQFNNGQLTQGVDPIGSADTTGSAWPAFGMTYYNATGRKVLLVPHARSGAAQAAAAHTNPLNNWDTTGQHYPDAVAQLNDAMAAARAAGYTPVFKGVLWHQGETDAIAINNGMITPSTYESAFRNMLARFRAEFGSSMPFYVFQLGIDKINGDSAGFAAVRGIQQSVTDTDPYTLMAFRNAVDYAARGLMKDQLHYNQAGLNEMGRIGAANVVSGQSQLTFQRQATTTQNLYFTPGNIALGTTSPSARLTVWGTGTTTSPIANFVNAASTTAFLVRADGRIGIGTTSPTSQVHISGPSPYLTLDGTGTGNSMLILSQSSVSKVFTGLINATNGMITGAASGDFGLRTQGGRVLFSTNSGASVSMILDGSGNLGLDTATPTSRLTLGSGQVGVPLGTMAAPSYSFTGDLNTGIYSNGADQIDFATAGQWRMGIAANGNVAIGSVNGTSVLTVNGNLSGNHFEVNDANATTLMSVSGTVAGGTALIQLGDADNGDTPILTLDQGVSGFSFLGGNVGVGVSPATQLLHVAGNVRIEGALYDSANAPGSAGSILTSTGTGTLWVATSTLAGTYFQQNGNSFGSTAILGTNDSTNLQFETAGVSRMAVTTDGNVGIGNLTPGTRLTVRGAAISGPVVSIEESTAGFSRLTLGLWNGAGMLTAYDENGNLTLNLAGTGASYFNAGNVGIGTTSPAFKLQVSGTGLASGDTSGQLALSASTNPLQKLYLGYDSTLGANGSGFIQAVQTGTGYTPLLLNPNGGNVGIGNTAPGEKLDVTGNIKLQNGTGFTTPNSLISKITSYAGAANQFQNASVDFLTGAFSDAGQIGFTVASGGVRSEAMRINSLGNVGIGTSSPAAQFQVGSATSRGFKVYGNTGPYGTALTGDTGGWAFGYNFEGNAGAALGGFGALGNSNGIESYYIGTFASQRMTILSAGNVGIGTSTPGDALHVARTGGAAIRLDDSNPSTGGYLRVTQIGNNTQFTSYNVAGSSLSIPMYFAGATGNVGIGTTSPNRTLTVLGAASVGSGATTAGVAFVPDASVGRIFGVNVANTAYNPLAFQTGVNPSVYITTAGTVGIGTTSPTSLLTVAQPTTGATNLRLATVDASNNIFFQRGATTYKSIRSPYLTVGDFAIYDDANTAVRFYMNAAGNVGIGSTNPVGLLTVGGTQGGNAGFEVMPTTAVLLQSYNRTTSAYTAFNFDASSFQFRPSAVVANGMNITSGNVAIGGAAGSTAERVDIVYSGANTQYGIGMQPVTDNTTAISFYNAAGTTVGSITQTNSAVVYNTTSDRRLKENIALTTRGLETLRRIQVQDYNFKNDPNNRTQGYIAQDLYEIYPEAVHVGSGVSNPWGVDYGRMTPLLVKSIQDLDLRTLSLAPAAENQAAHSLAVSADATVAGKLTVSGSAHVLGGLETASVLASGSMTARTFLAAADAGLPDEVLTDGSADLLKMARYAITGIQDIQERTDFLDMRIDDVEARVAALEAQHQNASSTGAGPISLTASVLRSALAQFGVFIEDGLAAFKTLSFRQLLVSSDDEGKSVAGSETVLAGNTVARIDNPYVHPTSKIFVTFTSPVSGAWYISEKQEGSFRVTLENPQGSDVTFDYFILQTDGQAASPSAATNPPPAPPTPTAPGTEPGTGTTTPPAPPGPSDTTPPTLALTGPAATEIEQGGAWSDPGATAADETDGDLTAQIVTEGSVDTAAPGVYTVTYSVSDAAGNQARVSRVVTVRAPEAPAPAPEPPPAPEASPVP